MHQVFRALLGTAAYYIALLNACTKNEQKNLAPPSPVKMAKEFVLPPDQGHNKMSDCSDQGPEKNTETANEVCRAPN